MGTKGSMQDPTHKQYQQYIHSIPKEKEEKVMKKENLMTTIFDYLTAFYFDMFVRIGDDKVETVTSPKQKKHPRAPRKQSCCTRVNGEPN
jgi:hypothetical protein